MTRASILGCAALAAGLFPLAPIRSPRGALADTTDGSGDQIRDLQHIACDAESAATIGTSTCPFYGCPHLPRDVLYDEKAKESVDLLSAVASGKASRDGTPVADPVAAKGSDGDDQKKFPSFDEALGELSSSGTDAAATLTLIGYKGGPVEKQINQDRAFVVSPFRVPSHSAATDDGEVASVMDKCIDRQLLRRSTPAAPPQHQFLGVFDGHDKLGEKVSQYATDQMPKLVAAKLAALAAAEARDGGWSHDQRVEATKGLLSDAFVEVDSSGRRDLAIPSGGCTASVVLRADDMLYVANAGDSRSIVAVYNGQTGKTRVVYASREDKPDLTDERARVEQSGGRVYIPKDPRESTRVFYLDSNNQARGGLAMSRSLGDWDLRKVGVIPDPIVDAISITDIVAAETTGKENSCQSDSDAAGGDDEGTCVADAASATTEDDAIRIVAVSATDGVLDYISPHDIAEEIATSLFGASTSEESGGQNDKHVLAAISELLATSSESWHKEMRGTYRDDMAISAAVIK